MPSDGRSASADDELRPSPEAQARATLDSNSVKTYRQRVYDLIAKAHDAPQRTPDTAERFAWFLLMCDDESFRDPPRALELAKSVAKETPERGGVWFTLALAHYRNGDWQSADDAVQQSIKLARDDEMKTYDWLLLAMIRYQQGRMDEARQWQKKAEDWIAKNDPSHEDEILLRLTTETSELQNELAK